MVLVTMRCVCHQHRLNLILKVMDLLPRPQQHQQLLMQKRKKQRQLLLM